MASKCTRIFNGASISSLKSALKIKPSINKSATTSFPNSSPVSRFTFSRVPSELGGLQSMLPLHSAVSVARMTSCLSLTSRRCAALLQDGSVNAEVTLLADHNSEEVFLHDKGKLMFSICPPGFYRAMISIVNHLDAAVLNFCR